MEKPIPKHKFSDLFYNRTTYFGIVLAFVIFLTEIFFFWIDFFSEYRNFYLGIITYTILPPFLILGLTLIPVGALRRRGKILKGIKTARRVPIYINFNNPKHWKAFIVFVIGTVILIVMSAVGSYQAYHYTESVHFCGIACHDVMEPQFVRYLDSPHARVKCVECHIGEGVDSYVNAKLSGTRQVVSLFRKTYPRPITGPVRNMQSAEKICAECHWPEKQYGSFEFRRQYFLTEDGDHPSWFLRMLVQMGGKDKDSAGIHAHMYLNNDIYFVAEDEKRQEISWVKTIDNQGGETIYTPPDSPYMDKEPPPELIKRMDCIDCHNRPAHHFMAPYQLINEAMAAGSIDPGLPGIKEKAMEALSGKYATREEAADSIRRSLTGYYQKRFNGSYEPNRQKIMDAVEKIISIYGNNFFPGMNARWDVYPDNIGHLISPGCFRCHDGEHSSPSGKVISRDCTSCHSIIEQGAPGNIEKSMEGLPFRHPVNIDEAWKEMNCFNCHTGN